VAKWNADAANIAAERDAWKRRAEVAEERLRAVEAENEALEKERERIGRLLVSGGRGDWRDRLADWISGGLVSYWYRMFRESAEERDSAYRLCRELKAELARIRAADRTSITVRTETAAQMRKGQAI
jgi:hypothetical protein